jgi:hypothetical protein
MLPTERWSDLLIMATEFDPSGAGLGALPCGAPALISHVNHI